MQNASSTADLFDACIVLFGSEIDVSIDFINYLQPEGLRAAYRKKVLETHPDRAITTGEDATRMNADFIRATTAYRTLSAVVMNGGVPSLNDVARDDAGIHRDDSKNKPVREKEERFFTGKIPGRKLLICQFLYYSGYISWNSYIDALVWQRRRRPPVGQIARDLGLLSENEIQAILKQRAIREKFGEGAIRLGYLTPYKLMVLLGKQRRFQRQIGDYFVKTGILSRKQIEQMAQKQLLHNKNIS